MTSDRIQHIARYRSNGRVCVGRLEGDEFVRLDAPPWSRGVETGERDRRAGVELLPPVIPTKVVCVGLNYRAHIAESQTVLPGGAKEPVEPLIFLKPPSAVIASGEPIQYPHGVTRLDPEAELAIVIARRARAVTPERALEFVAGYTCFNDVSARNYQRQDGQWTRAKGFDTFAPLGPWVTAGLSASDVVVECRVNGQTRQRGRTSDLIFPVPFLVSHVSRVMTLEPGDVIATGTPAGIAPVEVGDMIEIEIEGIGVLENRVEKAAD
jgi:2-keto-4-pentenoate hydratase/2-oxohepta-3-ene-1,7-dioic acid hydratase in catechol pathway